MSNIMDKQTITGFVSTNISCQCWPVPDSRGSVQCNRTAQTSKYKHYCNDSDMELVSTMHAKTTYWLMDNLTKTSHSYTLLGY